MNIDEVFPRPDNADRLVYTLRDRELIDRIGPVSISILHSHGRRKSGRPPRMFLYVEGHEIGSFIAYKGTDRKHIENMATMLAAMIRAVATEAIAKGRNR